MIENLINVQVELKAPKGQYNSFGKYKYRSCEDILEAVKPLLAKYKLLLTLSDEPVAVGNRVYIKATATLTDGKETITTYGFAREQETKKGMDESQITGTASSYARKYALDGLFLIDDTKDADATNTGETSKPKQTEAQKAADKRERMIAKCTRLRSECIANGVKEEGINSHAQTAYNSLDMGDYTDDQIISFGKYLAQLAQDSATLKAQREQAAQTEQAAHEQQKEEAA